jgi:7-carboxy-7-deazaguanine synthase
MSYQVKEIYYTLQGEGARAGRAAVFLRFAGCNLWSGLERDRARAVCQFCDTEFVGTDGPGGGKFPDAAALARAVREKWPAHSPGKPYVVCTGGEPLLQIDEALIDALHGDLVNCRRISPVDSAIRMTVCIIAALTDMPITTAREDRGNVFHVPVS